MAPRLIPGPQPLLSRPEGDNVSLRAAMPPWGSGRLLIFYFPDNPGERREIAHAWQWSKRHGRGPLRPVVVTARPDRIRNFAAWMQMADPLWISPDRFYDRLRIPGMPALVFFNKSKITKCLVITR